MTVPAGFDGGTRRDELVDARPTDWSPEGQHRADEAQARLAIGSPGSGLGRRRWRWRPGRPRRRLLRKVVLLVVLAVIAYVGGTFVQVWQASREDHARGAEAIVVLGAAQYDGRVSQALQDRLDHALALYRQKRAPVIVVTGGRQVGDRFTEATAGYNYLRKHGVPDEAIRKEVQGRNTYESLASASRFLRKENIDNVLLVSGPAHSKRLAGIATDVGLHAATSPASGSPSIRRLVRETVAVSLGRVIGYRRLERVR